MATAERTMHIPITKAGKGVTFSVDLDTFSDLDQDVQKAIIAAGYEKYLNARMTKLPAASKLEGDDLKEAKVAALAKAEENLADLHAGKLTNKTKSKSTEKREVLTEATRLAKEVVKNELRKQKVRVSLVKQAEITAYAKKLIEDDPQYIEQAKINLAERAKVPTLSIDLSKIGLDPKKVAKAEEAKATRKSQLSAKQAGMPATRKGKGKVPPSRPKTAIEAEAHVGFTPLN